jgi:GH15 family glucan-1,4-alpha-glucosidase
MSVPGSRPALALRDLIHRSVEVIEAEQAASGAYPACPTFPVYRFSWLRDGSFTADGMTAHDRSDSAGAFHDWVAGVVSARRERIEAVVGALAASRPIDPSWYLPTRYTLGGADAGDDWWNFQLDGYGTWLWALERHLTRTGENSQRFRPAASLVARYLCALWRTPCYDWWEEHAEQVHVSTLACIAAGLRAALRGDLLSPADAAAAQAVTDDIVTRLNTEAAVDGRLRKWLGSTAVDASTLAAVAPLEVVSGAIAERTVAAVERQLVADRGVHRFRADVFYGGGRWPVLAGLLGQAYLRLGRVEDARAQLEWIAGTADDAGLLPEQVSDLLLAPGSYDSWVSRWGPVARPLLWSHGQFLTLAAEVGVRA